MPAVASRNSGVFGTSSSGMCLRAWLSSLSRWSGPTSCGWSPNVETPGWIFLVHFLSVSMTGRACSWASVAPLRAASLFSQR
jgi:hypothetical protein